jgi:hypothetical protein
MTFKNRLIWISVSIVSFILHMIDNFIYILSFTSISTDFSYDWLVYILGVRVSILLKDKEKRADGC